MLFAVEDGGARRERVCRQLDSRRLGEMRRTNPISRLLAIEGGPSPTRSRVAARVAYQHLEVLAQTVRSLLGDEDAPEELVDLGVATLAAVDTLRAPGRRHHPLRDCGTAGARVGRCAAEALRAHATLAAPPHGAPVPDVPASLWGSRPR